MARSTIVKVEPYRSGMKLDTQKGAKRATYGMFH